MTQLPATDTMDTEDGDVVHGDVDTFRRSTLQTCHGLITSHFAKTTTIDRMCKRLAGLGRELMVQIMRHTAECRQHF